MNKAFLVTAFLAFAQVASATQILSYYPKIKDGNITASIYSGFMEDGFSRAPNICYLGSVKGVCALIKTAQIAADRRYSSGDHGTFTILECRVEGSVVKLTYDRVSDYPQNASDKNIKLDIKACSDQN